MTISKQKHILLPALALASTSAAAAAGIVNGHIGVKAVGNVVVAAAATTDLGYSACVTASAVLQACDDLGYLDEDSPPASLESCVCCASTVDLDPLYAACASYAYYEEPSATEAYERMLSPNLVTALIGFGK